MVRCTPPPFCVASALVLSLAVLAPPAAAQEQNAKLARKIDFPGLEDPRITLREALDYLGARYEWKIQVDANAFKAQGVKDIQNAAVAEKPLPRQARVTVGILLQQVLNRLPQPATYTVQRDRLAVVPVSDAVLKEIAREYRTSPLRGLLARQVALGKDIKANATFKEVVAFLRDKHGLPVVIPQGAEDLQLEAARQTSVSIETLLKRLASEIGGACLLRNDHVLLIRRPLTEPPID